MNKNPIEEIKSEDEKAYIVLMKKQEYNNKESNESFILGAFKDGKILEEYYIRENNGEFIKVKKYKDVKLTEGSNIIELSLNGADVTSKIEVSFK